MTNPQLQRFSSPALADFNVYRFAETTSTNDEVKRLLANNPAKFTVAYTPFQTAGRGQSGNHWESAPDQNLLFSIGMAPTFLPPRQQFLLLQAASLAVCQALNQYKEGFTIKWPNDIYFKQYKISGTLIENELSSGLLQHSIIGTGINVNQTEFSTYPPNPISLKQILKIDQSPDGLLQDILIRFATLYRQLENGQLSQIRQLYRNLLFRKEGFHPYLDTTGRFLANISDIEDDGHLVLIDTEGHQRRYAFKEVIFILDQMET